MNISAKVMRSNNRGGRADGRTVLSALISASSYVPAILRHWSPPAEARRTCFTAARPSSLHARLCVLLLQLLLPAYVELPRDLWQTGNTSRPQVRCGFHRHPNTTNNGRG